MRLHKRQYVQTRSRHSVGVKVDRNRIKIMAVDVVESADAMHSLKPYASSEVIQIASN